MKKIAKLPVILLTCTGIALCAGMTACKPKTNKNAAEPDKPASQTPVGNHEHVFDREHYGTNSEYHWLNASCCENVTTEKKRHEYDDDTDTTCNICGFVREITPPETPQEQQPSEGDDRQEQNPPKDDDPQEQNPPKVDDPQEQQPPKVDDPKPDDDISDPQPVQPQGFEIEADADGLIIEGIENEYGLNKQMKAVDLNSLQLLVYTAVNGQKGTLISAENYQLTLYYGSTKQENTQKLTSEGTYTVSIALTDCYRSGGDKIDDGEISASIDFTIKNPPTVLSFLSGKTTQTSSPIDKLSASWQFEVERANGEKETVPADQITVAPLNTVDAGTHSATVVYGSLETEVQYEITARTVINSVNVKLKEDLATEITGEYLTLESGDFEVEISADGNYSAEKKVYYENAEVQTLTLAPQEAAHEVIVDVIISYAIDGEQVTATHSKTLEIYVTKKITTAPVTPPEPQTKFEGAELKKLLDGESTEITIEAENGFEITADEGGLTIYQFNAGASFDGLKFKLESAAEIIVNLSSPAAMVGVSTADGDVVYEIDFFCGETRYEYEIPDGGEYHLSILFLDDEDPTVTIGYIEIVY